MKGKQSKYGQVVETLRDEILNGKYASQAPFPSVAMIIRRFGISNLTAVKALGQLKEEGFVRSYQGRGARDVHFVLRPRWSPSVRDGSLPPREIYLPATLIERDSTVRPKDRRRR